MIKILWLNFNRTDQKWKKTVVLKVHHALSQWILNLKLLAKGSEEIWWCGRQKKVKRSFLQKLIEYFLFFVKLYCLSVYDDLW
jgi:hypothetical protein